MQFALQRISRTYVDKSQSCFNAVQMLPQCLYPAAKRNQHFLQHSTLDFQQSDEAHGMKMRKSLVEGASLVVSGELRKEVKVD